jgi:hypothetical protein
MSIDVMEWINVMQLKLRNAIIKLRSIEININYGILNPKTKIFIT